jgi:hypothetical protein
VGRRCSGRGGHFLEYNAFPQGGVEEFPTKKSGTLSFLAVKDRGFGIDEAGSPV